MSDEIKEQQLNDAEQAAKEEQEGMALGYAGEESPAPEPEPAPDPEPQEEPQPEPEPKPAPKPAENGDKDLEQRIVNLLDGRLRNHTGHVNKILDQRLEGFQAAAQAAKTATEQAGGETPTNAEIQAALKNSKAMQQLKEEFPEYAAAMEEANNILATHLESTLSEKLKGSSKEIDTSAFASTADVAEVKELMLVQRFPNIDKDVNSPEFSAWIETQPEEVQALGESNRLADAIRMMDAFHEHLKKQPAEELDPAPDAEKPPARPDPKKRLQAAVAPTSGNGGRPQQRVMSEDESLRFGYDHG